MRYWLAHFWSVRVRQRKVRNYPWQHPVKQGKTWTFRLTISQQTSSLWFLSPVLANRWTNLMTIFVMRLRNIVHYIFFKDGLSKTFGPGMLSNPILSSKCISLISLLLFSWNWKIAWLPQWIECCRNDTTCFWAMSSHGVWLLGVSLTIPALGPQPPCCQEAQAAWRAYAVGILAVNPS